MKNKICDYVIRKYGFENWKTIFVCRIFRAAYYRPFLNN